jgi:hypothetical protein
MRTDSLMLAATSVVDQEDILIDDDINPEVEKHGNQDDERPFGLRAHRQISFSDDGE